MAHDVVISSSVQDRAVAEAVCAALEHRGIRSLVLSDDGAGTGALEPASDVISTSHVMVVVLSASSSGSRQIARDVRRALAGGTVVVAIRIEEGALPDVLRTLVEGVPVFDAFPPPFDLHLKALADGIERVLSRDEAARPAAASTATPATSPAPSPHAAPMRPDRPRPMAAPRMAQEPAPQPQPAPPPTPEAAPGSLLSRAGRALRALFPGRERRSAKEADQPTSDHVHFSVTCPAAVRPGASFVINVWAHLGRQRWEVLRRAEEALGGAAPLVQTKGPARVRRGTILAVRVHIQDIAVGEPEDTILWDGEVGNATFGVAVPPEAQAGTQQGTVRIYAEGLEIARVQFTIAVDPAAVGQTTVTPSAPPHRSAFASYASEDRDAVLARIQGILKVVPDMDIFVDVARIRSGQNWEAALRREIVARDVFYLFWSEFARASEWVEREWRYALDARGLDFINPVPLATPDAVPPPPELAGKHFNDWVLPYMRGPRQ